MCDEGVEAQGVELLRGDGHSVVYVAELAAGISDDVLAEANRLEALLVTKDKDSGELVYRQGRANHGVLLFRLEGLPPAQKAAIVSSVVATHAIELQGAFTVIAPGHVRIRPRA